MLFNSLTFGFFFFFVFIIYLRLSSWRNAKIFLLGASYLFYGWWDARFILLIFSLTLVNLLCGKWIHFSSDDHLRKKYLWLSLGFSLGCKAPQIRSWPILNTAISLLKMFDLFVTLATISEDKYLCTYCNQNVTNP